MGQNIARMCCRKGRHFMTKKGAILCQEMAPFFWKKSAIFCHGIPGK